MPIELLNSCESVWNAVKTSESPKPLKPDAVNPSVPVVFSIHIHRSLRIIPPVWVSGNVRSVSLLIE